MSPAEAEALLAAWQDDALDEAGAERLLAALRTNPVLARRAAVTARIDAGLALVLDASRLARLQEAVLTHVAPTGAGSLRRRVLGRLRTRRWTWWTSGLVALALLLLVLLGREQGVRLSEGRLRGDRDVAIPGATLAAGQPWTVLEPAVLRWPDGSRIELTAGSNLKLARDGCTLEQGSLTAQVTARGREAFVVRMPALGARVVVLGTRFTVAVDAGTARVAVVEGRVQVETQVGRELLGAGAERVIVADAAPLRLPAVAAEWRSPAGAGPGREAAMPGSGTAEPGAPRIAAWTGTARAGGEWAATGALDGVDRAWVWSAAGGLQPIPVRVVDPGEVRVVMPLRFGSGPGLLWLVSPMGASPPVVLNRPDPRWWLAAAGPLPAPGELLTVLGRGLAGAEVRLNGAGGLRVLAVEEAGEHILRARLPTDLALGEHQLSVVQPGELGQSHALPVTLAAAWQRPAATQTLAPGEDGADDTPRFWAALGRLEQAGGGVLHLEAGRFRIVGNLPLPGGIHLHGAGPDRTELLLCGDPATSEGIRLDGDRIAISDLTLRQDKRRYATCSMKSAPAITCTGLRIERVRVLPGVQAWLLDGRGGAIHDCELACLVRLYQDGWEVSGCTFHGGNAEGDVALALHAWRSLVRGNRFIGDPESALTTAVRTAAWEGEMRHLAVIGNELSGLGGQGGKQAALHLAGLALREVPQQATVIGIQGDELLLDRALPAASCAVLVVAGPGLGQVRGVAAVDGARLRPDQPWRVPPALGSVVACGRAVTDALVLDNRIAGTGIVAHEAECWLLDAVFSGNRSTTPRGNVLLGDAEQPIAWVVLDAAQAVELAPGGAEGQRGVVHQPAAGE